MVVKKVLIILMIIFISLSLFSKSLADDDVEKMITVMKTEKGGIAGNADGGDKVIGVINNIIFIIQVAGTGISLLIVTIFGIKYMIASVEEKAEIKKQAMPILIGCILLFGAVNLVAIVADFSDQALGSI